MNLLNELNLFLDLAIANWRVSLIAIAAFTAMSAIIHANRESLSLWWVGARQRFPFVGKISRLAKQPSVTGSWFHSENQICSDYKEHYQRINKQASYYVACREYLDIVGETGRKPLTPFMVLCLFAVLVLEAWGFSYTMSGFLDISASEDTRQVMAWILSVTFAVTLATVTHKMGHEIHRNTIIHNVRELWKADAKQAETLAQQATLNAGAIENPSDTNERPYIRRLNRLALGRSHKTHTWTITAVVVILLIAAILTFIRVKSFETMQSMELVCGATSTATGGDIDFSTLYGEGSQTPSTGNDTTSNDSACKAAEQGSWATFALLGILFCVLQTFATWASTARGFAGKQSYEAWKYTHQFNTVEEFKTHFDNKKRQVANAAQKSLSSLQSKMSTKLTQVANSTEVTELIKTASERTFFKFIEKESKELADAEYSTKQIESANSVKSVELKNETHAKISSLDETKQQDEENRRKELKQRMLKLTAATPETKEEADQRMIDEVEKELGLTLTAEQRESLLTT
ncbi:hypothetical protein F7U66_01440 [Vibrio parahaemolyticus]|nr:hypothetical protein [Vibrio parahaemolyticus]